MKTNKKEFGAYLKQKNLAENTIRAYLTAYQQYEENYGRVTRGNLLKYKNFLMEQYKPKTVNLRLRAINCYLEYEGKEELKMSLVKIQQKTYLENVISDADYFYLKNCLKKDEEWFWYFVVHYLASTGARVSELVQIKAEHVQVGYLDLYSKGGKMRRIYIPERLRNETLQWLEKMDKKSGFLFLNKKGRQISTRGIYGQLKYYAKKYGIPEEVVYPHSFRHRFAKNFLEKYQDIALLADLMGHESIETTRIYLRKTSMEQKRIVDMVVDW